MDTLIRLIETAYENRVTLNPLSVDPKLQAALLDILNQLETGRLRVAELIGDEWQVNQWIKKAILLYFCLHQSQPIPAQFTQFYDKVPLQFTDTSLEDFVTAKIRLVPPATVRRGAFIGSNSVIMPSFVNIGAYVGAGTMVDTWVTVGSCSQIGERVHLSSNVCIGGVLEPLQANPVIIEDDCFIGAGSAIVEGVIVEKGAVISMGVHIGQSTRIFDRQTGEIYLGRVPAYSVVVPGTLPSIDGRYHLYCAVIVKRVDEKTRQKVAINELLRVKE